MKQRLHWTCQSPSPYNDYLFAALAADSRIDLLVHFVEGASGDHPWQWTESRRFPHRVFKAWLGIDWKLLSASLWEPGSYFLLGGWRAPTLIALAAYLGLARRRFTIWTDAPDVFSPRSGLKERLRSLWLRWLFRSARAVLGTGTMALDHLRAMGCPSEKLINFPYIVDTRPFASASGSARGRRNGGQGLPVFLSSGRLINAPKGYDLALRALALARTRGELGRFRYRIAGTGPDEASLRHLAIELDLQEETEFVGWLQPAELPAFYASGEYFLHPARFEPYGVVIVEAMASGLVVIGSDRTGAIVDRVAPRQAGFVHRTDDVEDLARAIVAATRAPDRNEGVIARACEAAQEWPVERAVALLRDLATRDH